MIEVAFVMFGISCLYVGFMVLVNDYVDFLIYDNPVSICEQKKEYFLIKRPICFILCMFLILGGIYLIL